MRSACRCFASSSTALLGPAYAELIGLFGFYADMLVLQDLLRPTFTTDELGEVAIRPGYYLVKGWLDEHRRR
jgi:hypothetical protein